MVSLDTLRARIAELERYPATEYTQAPVRKRANFDLQALRELLALREKEGTTDAGELPS